MDLILLCNNRRVFDTSFILKILSYTTDTKLFDVKSILVKHVVMGPDVRNNSKREYKNETKMETK